MRLRSSVSIVASVALGSAVMAGGPAAAQDFSKPVTGFAPATTVLHDASPRDVGLDPAPIAEAVKRVRGHEEAPESGRPLYAGAVALMGHDGAIVERDASGYALRYETGTTELPRDRWMPMREDTIFDLASVSKLFTSIAVVQLLEEGKVELDAPVAAFLPDFAANAKESVTVRQLLTHTSGFTAWLPLYSRYSDKASRIKAVMDQPLTNPPGTTYLYSDLNVIALGVLVERLRGEPLDAVIRERVTEPLGMAGTGYNPRDRVRTAATEYQALPSRGMVWGEVHDENAWSLGGVAGHAGVFSTADDLAVLAQTLINGGVYRGERILSRKSVAQLITNVTEGFPGDDHGLGFELNQRWYMDALSGPRTAGHTGYTGTSFVIDFASQSFAILLANRVHPSRSWGSNNVARREWARGLALAMDVRATHGDTAWFSGAEDSSTHTLTTPELSVPGGGARLGFDLFLDTEETDLLVLERSTDGGATWGRVPFEIRDRGEATANDGVVSGGGDRRWVQARATLDAGAALFRWRYTTDGAYLGRGVLVDDIVVTSPQGVLLDGEKDLGAFSAEGWVLTGREAVA
jgi:CubicO group peptidase (beta-lactamase class C family)